MKDSCGICWVVEDLTSRGVLCYTPSASSNLAGVFCVSLLLHLAGVSLLM
ncbi:hypothetical protein Hanom_Chr10g00961731 [Helianthus anomalus]